MTVRELSVLARYISQTYPEFYKNCSRKGVHLEQDPPAESQPAAERDGGRDGLKTGYTKEGGYGHGGSAVQIWHALIVVVNGLEDPDDRATEAKRRCLEWAFVISRREFFSRPTSAWLCAGVRRREPLGQAGQPRAGQVMCRKNGVRKADCRACLKRPGPRADRGRSEESASSGSGAAQRRRRNAGYAPEPVGTGSTVRRALDGVSELVHWRCSAQAAEKP